MRYRNTMGTEGIDLLEARTQFDSLLRFGFSEYHRMNAGMKDPFGLAGIFCGQHTISRLFEHQVPR